MTKKDFIRYFLISAILFLLISFFSPCKYSTIDSSYKQKDEHYWKICGPNVMEIYHPSGFVYDAWWEMWGILKFGSFLFAIIPVISISVLGSILIVRFIDNVKERLK